MLSDKLVTNEVFFGSRAIWEMRFLHASMAICLWWSLFSLWLFSSFKKRFEVYFSALMLVALYGLDVLQVLLGISASWMWTSAAQLLVSTAPSAETSSTGTSATADPVSSLLDFSFKCVAQPCKNSETCSSHFSFPATLWLCVKPVKGTEANQCGRAW